jgi:uncharacterized Zn finger protein
MCEHENNRIIKTTGTHFTKQCLTCGHKWKEEKVIKIEKKSLIKKLFGG